MKHWIAVLSLLVVITSLWKILSSANTAYSAKVQATFLVDNNADDLNSFTNSQ